MSVINNRSLAIVILIICCIMYATYKERSFSIIKSIIHSIKNNVFIIILIINIFICISSQYFLYILYGYTENIFEIIFTAVFLTFGVMLSGVAEKTCISEITILTINSFTYAQFILFIMDIDVFNILIEIVIIILLSILGCMAYLLETKYQEAELCKKIVYNLSGIIVLICIINSCLYLIKNLNDLKIYGGFFKIVFNTVMCNYIIGVWLIIDSRIYRMFYILSKLEHLNIKKVECLIITIILFSTKNYIIRLQNLNMLDCGIVNRWSLIKLLIKERFYIE